MGSPLRSHRSSWNSVSPTRAPAPWAWEELLPRWRMTRRRRSPIQPGSSSSRGRKCRSKEDCGSTRRRLLSVDRFDGSEPSGILLDDTAGLRIARSVRDLAGLSFLSFVYPKEDWSLAVYRHQSAKFEFRGASQGFFARAGAPFTGDRREIDFRTSVDLDVVNYGVSLAYRPTDALSLGVGASYVNGRFTSDTEVFFPNANTLPDGFFGPNSYDPESRTEISSLTIDDWDWTFNLGFLWHTSSRWSVGGFFRKAPEFVMEGRAYSGPFLKDVPEGTLLDIAESPIAFPNVFGVGVAFKSKGEGRDGGRRMGSRSIRELARQSGSRVFRHE